MKNKIRLEWVDCLKFLGIYAIYIGHFGSSAGVITPFVFSYHVPLFFFAAGFFAKKGDLSLIMFTWEKFKRLMIPYFTFAILIILIKALSAGYDVKTIINIFLEHTISGIRTKPFVGSIWFINCLFTILIIDNISLRILKSNNLVFLISLLSFVVSQTILGHNPLITPKWFWNLDSAMAYWWCLSLGRLLFTWLCNKKFLEKSLGGHLIFSFLIFSAAYQLYDGKSFLMVVSSLISQSFSHGNIFYMADTLYTTTSLILLNVFIAKIISSSTIIQSMGRNTLNICGLEYITKLFIPSIIALFGLNFAIKDPYSAIAYTFFCLYISNIAGRWLSDKINGPFKIHEKNTSQTKAS